jgi:hypothetical protein
VVDGAANAFVHILVVFTVCAAAASTAVGRTVGCGRTAGRTGSAVGRSCGMAGAGAHAGCGWKPLAWQLLGGTSELR